MAEPARYCHRCDEWHTSFGDHKRSCPKEDAPNRPAPVPPPAPAPVKEEKPPAKPSPARASQGNGKKAGKGKK